MNFAVLIKIHGVDFLDLNILKLVLENFITVWQYSISQLCNNNEVMFTFFMTS